MTSGCPALRLPNSGYIFTSSANRFRLHRGEYSADIRNGFCHTYICSMGMMVEVRNVSGKW